MMGIPIFWMLIVIAILLLVGVRKLYAIANNTELSRELEKHESQINELIGVNRAINRTLQERLLNLRDGFSVYDMSNPEKDE
jgi:hypothetical protein